MKPIVAIAPRVYALRSMLNDRSSALSLLATRRSAKPRELIGPGPSAAEFERMLTIAARAPDHGKLTPWRFVSVAQDQRDALAELFQASLSAEDPEAPAAKHQKAHDFAHYPAELVVLISAPVPDHKIPLWEQELSAGAVGMNLLIAAHAMGYVAAWVTGWYAYSEQVRRGLCGAGERIAGFIFIGHAGRELEERDRPTLADIWRKWHPRGN